MHLIKNLLIVAGLANASVANADHIQDWITRMNASTLERNYQGTFVFWRDNKLEAMQVQHGIRGNEVWEQLESLNGEQRKLIHDKGKVTSIFPAKKLVTINSQSGNLPFHPGLPENLEKLNQHYDLKVIGTDRIAKQETQIIEVAPRDNYRYGFKYWLDTNTGMMLRCDVIDAQKKVLEQVMFTDLKYMENPPRQAFKDVSLPDEYTVVNQNENQLLNGGHSWSAKSLPGGFMLTKNLIKPMKGHQGTVQHMVFSDGLATVSAFIGKNSHDPHQTTGHMQMGSVNAFGRVINDFQITVIGEVPLDTVKLIAESLSYQPQGNFD